MYNSIEESLSRIEEALQNDQRKGNRTNDV